MIAVELGYTSDLDLVLGLDAPPVSCWLQEEEKFRGLDSSNTSGLASDLCWDCTAATGNCLEFRDFHGQIHTRPEMDSFGIRLPLID